MENKKVFDDFNVSTRIRKALQKSVIISDELNLEEINTFSLILALLLGEGSVLKEIYTEQGVSLLPKELYYTISHDKEMYEEIFQREYTLGNEQESEDGDTEQTSQIGEKTENLSDKEVSEELNDKEPKNKIEIDANQFLESVVNGVIDVLNDMEYDFDLSYLDMPYSNSLEAAIIDAGIRCRESGQDYIDEENLMYSILNLPNDCSAKRYINIINESLREQNSEFDFDIIDIIENLLSKNIYFTSSDKKKLSIPKPLENCCKIVNYEYEEGCECDILGRDNEILEVWNILSKKQKSNSILLGKSGVGKSAIVEAITMSIVNGTCPKNFIGYSVIFLNVTGMVAGTKYRGEFEKKIDYLLKFIEGNDNIILFVDEMHQIMGAGDTSEGSLNLNNSLKPLLSRDKVKFIGATTLDEYQKYICRDSAFRRRFENVIVEEPRQAEVLPMLKVKIENLKKYHEVEVDSNVLDYIQLCAACFNTTTCNPDKTLDLIDRSMAMAKIEGSKSVLIEHVEKVFSKNYKKFDNISQEEKEATSYHETGHFVAHMLYRDILVDEEVYAISIVPGFDFVGANVIENTGYFTSSKREAYEAEIACLLAGRIAESFYTRTISGGASSDLGKATAIAKNMIVKCGLAKGKFSNISVYNQETGNDLPLSDNTLDDIAIEAKRIIDRVYKRTESLLIEHEEKIQFIAEELLKKKIIKASDYYYLFEDTESTDNKQ